VTAKIVAVLSQISKMYDLPPSIGNRLGTGVPFPSPVTAFRVIRHNYMYEFDYFNPCAIQEKDIPDQAAQKIAERYSNLMRI
jgi:hypothetical protein